MSLSRSLTQRISNKLHRSNSTKQQEQEEDQFVSINYDNVEQPKQHQQPKTLSRAASLLSRKPSSKTLSAVSTTTSIATTPAALTSPASSKSHKHTVSVSSSSSSCYSASMASSVQTSLDDQPFYSPVATLDMPVIKDETCEADAVAMRILEKIDSDGELNWAL